MTDSNMSQMIMHAMTLEETGVGFEAGSARIPDFTIEDDEPGIRYYWEHLGMLHLPEYRDRELGILPYEEGGGDAGQFAESPLMTGMPASSLSLQAARAQWLLGECAVRR